MAKRIICIERELPGLETHSFRSDQSLLDAEIIVFQPDVDSFLLDRQQGYPCCPESWSPQCIESIRYWRTEIETAVRSGKTVFVLLNKLKEFVVFSGEKEYSGTGRNQKATRLLSRRSPRSPGSRP